MASFWQKKRCIKEVSPMKKRLKILVPVDFSELSKDTFFAAAELAKKINAQMIVMHVIDYIPGSPFFLEGSLPENREYLVDVRISKERELDKLTEDEKVRGVPMHSIFVVGVAEKEIVEKAKRYRADLIVMSTHGRTGVSHFLLGSVAEQVVRKAPCPVLTLNPQVLGALKKGELTASEILHAGSMQAC